MTIDRLHKVICHYPKIYFKIKKIGKKLTKKKWNIYVLLNKFDVFHQNSTRIIIILIRFMLLLDTTLF